jgi:hypothetical protein
MQRQWRGCNLPPPGDSNRVLAAVDPSKEVDGTGGLLRLICIRVAIRKRGRQRNPDGLTLRLTQSEELNKEGFRDEQ